MYLFRCTYFILSVFRWRVYICISVFRSRIFHPCILFVPFSFIFYSISYYSLHFSFCLSLFTYIFIRYSRITRCVGYLIVISVCIKGTDEEEGNETFINADERSDFPPGGGANIFLNDNGNRYTSGIMLSLLGTNNN